MTTLLLKRTYRLEMKVQLLALVLNPIRLLCDKTCILLYQIILAHRKGAKYARVEVDDLFHSMRGRFHKVFIMDVDHRPEGNCYFLVRVLRDVTECF